MQDRACLGLFGAATVVAATIVAVVSTATVAAAQTASVNGRIVDAHTRAPLADAHVVLVRYTTRNASRSVEVELVSALQRAATGVPRRPEAVGEAALARANRWVTSDADGAFAFNDVAPGEYQLLVGRTGHVGQWATSSPSVILNDTVFVLRAAQSATFDIGLVQVATLRGRVLDALGQPVARVGVTAGPLGDTTFTELLLSGRSSTPTTSDGVFELTVAPGLHHISAYPISIARQSTSAYMRTFYPGVASVADATAIRASSGEVVTGLDIVLAADPRKTISGVVVPRSHGGAIELQLRSRGYSTDVKVDKDGRFSVVVRAEGRNSFLLIARAQGDSGVDMAVETVEPEMDSSELILTLGESGRLTGEIVTTSGSPLAVAGVRVVASLHHGEQDFDPLGRDRIDTDESGAFAIDGVSGERRLAVYGLPPEWTVDRIEHAGAAVDSFTIAAGEHVSGVRIVVRPQ